jgi:hypothetical protein
MLLHVDLTTGKVVANAFGTNRDYMPMNFLPGFPGLEYVDDIAIDLCDGPMYALVNDSAVSDRLARVNKHTGKMSDVGAFGIGEVEGMSFDPHGQLPVTAGGTDNSVQYYLYQVDKTTGAATNPRQLNKSSNLKALPGPYVPPPTAEFTPTTDAHLATGTNAPAPTPTGTQSPPNT